MSPEVQNLFLVLIPLAVGGLILAILKGATQIVNSHSAMVEATNQALATQQKGVTDAAIEREKLLIAMFNDVRAEVAELKQEDKAKDDEIKSLLKQLAELPRLELEIEKLRTELKTVRLELEGVKQAREERERELQAANQRANAADKRADTAEAKQKELEKLLLKEKTERAAESQDFKKRIAELKEQVEMHESRMGTIEGKLGTAEVPGVSQ